MGVSVAFNETIVHMNTQLSNRWKHFSAIGRILRYFIGLISVKTQGQSKEIYVTATVRLILYYNVMYNHFMFIRWFYTNKDTGVE
jgi:hypothetical protein